MENKTIGEILNGAGHKVSEVKRAARPKRPGHVPRRIYPFGDMSAPTEDKADYFDVKPDEGEELKVLRRKVASSARSQRLRSGLGPDNPEEKYAVEIIEEEGVVRVWRIQ